MDKPIRLFAFAVAVFLSQNHPQLAAQTPPPKRAAARPSAVIKHAEWSPSLESLVGLSQEQFRQASLGRLTEDEFASLLTSFYTNEQKMVKNALSAQLSVSCSPGQTDFQKVRIFVDVNEKTPSEIASGIRERLRALPDVEIVYDAMDADFGVAVLGLRDQTEAGRPLGFSLSVVTYDPCKESIGDKDWQVRMVRNHFVNVAPDEAQTIERVVSQIDTDDIEDTRKLHAAINKSKARK